MSVYLIVLENNDADAWDRLRAKWPSHNLILNERVAFVAPEGITLTTEVCETIGFNDNNKVSGSLPK